jgi:hypothetical protein
VSSNHSQDVLRGPRAYNGIAPDAKVVVVKAFDDNGWGSYASVIRGIEWVVTNSDTTASGVLNCASAPPRSHYWRTRSTRHHARLAGGHRGGGRREHRSRRADRPRSPATCPT